MLSRETLTRNGILETELPDFPDWVKITHKNMNIEITSMKSSLFDVEFLQNLKENLLYSTYFSRYRYGFKSLFLRDSSITLNKFTSLIFWRGMRILL